MRTYFEFEVIDRPKGAPLVAFAENGVVTVRTRTGRMLQVGKRTADLLRQAFDPEVRRA